MSRSDTILAKLGRDEAEALTAATKGVRGPLSPLVETGREKLRLALDPRAAKEQRERPVSSFEAAQEILRQATAIVRILGSDPPRVHAEAVAELRAALNRLAEDDLVGREQ